MFVIHLSGSFSPRASELVTTTYKNTWKMNMRNLFLDPTSELFVQKLTYQKNMAITRLEAQGAHFLPPYVSHILFLYLVLVLPFTWILERKIQPSGNHSITLLLFSNNYQSLGVYHLAKVMYKYSQKILGQHIILSVYRHIIIAMI